MMKQARGMGQLVACILAVAFLAGCDAQKDFSSAETETSSQTNSAISGEGMVSCIATEEDGLSVEEVKAIFEPLLDRAYSVNFGFMFSGTNGTTILPKGTRVPHISTTISLPTDYYLMDHTASPFSSFHSLEEIRVFTEEAYTEECAYQAYYSRFLSGHSPKIVEYEGKLYNNGADGTEGVECDLETLRVLEQREDWIWITFECWVGDSDTPDIGLLSAEKTENGWRLDRSLLDVPY